ncbi:uncharacterized protein LOC121858791 [Homarus americanus]|uniref:Putative snRNA-activating protein complex subunit 19-like n=1 Tax=Homarus americanus TaxID=6706 RepID=A0A8J5N8S4_HOMAM|nr:uncharacterized protein LOC121858791 [Homarus americanus]XP_042211362.1 uncharacterized protein LOC121858791 [Homarus americanus]XP_042211363.1 uncharacterized protein LOC121858791 [Homarus americanus]KAG7174878.1 putative snRNA-activating protein complex subunit 19-like [Homarus americanus]
MNQERLQKAELIVLQKEETTLKELIDKYMNSLYKLKVEELTIKHQLSRIQDVELRSQNNTSQEAVMEDPLQLPDMSLMMNDQHPNTNQMMVIMNELHINKSALNLEAAPLIQRMLHDSEVYEEEEEDEKEKVDVFEE